MKTLGTVFAVIATAATLSSILMGCNKKPKECAAVAQHTNVLRPKVEIFVGDESGAASKAAMLGDLVTAAGSTDAALAKMTPSDEGVRRDAAAYRQALPGLVRASKDLKAILGQIPDADKERTQLLTTEEAGKRAFGELLSSTSVAEKETLAPKLTGLGSGTSPDDLEMQARVVESTKFRDPAGRAAAASYVRNLREAARLKLSLKLERSKAQRDAFADARDTFRKADQALVQTCTPPR